MALFLVFPLFSFSKLIMPVQVVDLIIIRSCSLYILFYFFDDFENKRHTSTFTLELVLARMLCYVVELILLLLSNK